MTNQNPNEDIFNSLADPNSTSEDVLDQIISHFRETGKPMELFEALKMRTRIRLGLPLISPENEVRRAEDIERQLEQGLLDACRETGAMLIQLGRVGEGWMYLRPTGDMVTKTNFICTYPKLYIEG